MSLHFLQKVQNVDQLKQLQAFVAVYQKGSLSLAAKALEVSPAIIGRRLDALELRLGVKLVIRTTRTLVFTPEGDALLEHAQRILTDLANVEAAVSVGSIKVSGHLRITAPAGFGRKHVAPTVAQFIAIYPEVSCMLDLSDRVVDLLNEGYDAAIRIGELPDSSLVSVLLAQNQRVIVASPAYLAQYGMPLTPEALNQHHCMALSTQRGWQLQTPEGRALMFKPQGRLECNDGAVLREWALSGLGIAWRSWWEVAEDIQNGQLQTLLDAYAAPPIGIYMVFPQRKHLALRVRFLIDFFKTSFKTRLTTGEKL